MYSSVSFSNMPIDPNEPRYCYCQRVSFGEMVACDNEEVRKKLFSFTFYSCNKKKRFIV